MITDRAAIAIVLVTLCVAVAVVLFLGWVFDSNDDEHGD